MPATCRAIVVFPEPVTPITTMWGCRSLRMNILSAVWRLQIDHARTDRTRAMVGGIPVPEVVITKYEG